MRRDLDIVRYTLMTAESAEVGVDETTLCSSRYDINQIAFHVELLRDYGLVEAEVSYDGFGEEPLGVTVSRLTWDGYDYLYAIRSAKVWGRAKDAISKAVGETSLSVVKQTCTVVASALIKKQLGI